MRSDVRRDFDWSSSMFTTVVWPTIGHACGGGEIHPVEDPSGTGGIKRDLDILAGIDAWQVIRPDGIRGIACRVQRLKEPRCWSTFTIRYHRASGSVTEYHKRHDAIMHPEKGLLFPHLTVQAYIYESKLWCCGVVKTADMFAYVAANMQGNGQNEHGRYPVLNRPLWMNETGDGTAVFICVPWRGMISAGIQMYVLDNTSRMV